MLGRAKDSERQTKIIRSDAVTDKVQLHSKQGQIETMACCIVYLLQIFSDRRNSYSRRDK
jgi:hypothetical protein